MIRIKIEKVPKEKPKTAAGSWEQRARQQKDPRITAARFSWKEFLVLWFSIMVITTGSMLILSQYTPEIKLSMLGTMATLGYGALMALIFVLLTILWRRFVYERPLKLLGAAAREVAQGDFSVRLPDLHKRNKKHDYLDVMYEDFNTMVHELNSIETLKDDFIGNVSHEIKTPLATIENYASALKRQKLDDTERAEYTEAIMGATKRLSALVSNILWLNKLENQGITPDSRPYDMAEQLRNCVLGFETLWESKNIEMEVDVDDTCFIEKDETLLELVWNNLISNAIKFTEPGGMIKVSQRADLAHIRIDIADTGLGMDEGTQQRVFDKFYQGDTSHSQEGNGLGLALAARALKLAGGDISLSSKPGEGSTFTVWFDSR